MKYKVGDRVRIIKNDENDFKIGEMAIIDKIDEDAKYSVYCKNERNCEWVTEEEITPFDYTWEDFLKAPIGTKVTFEGGKYLFKIDKDKYGDEFTNMYDNYAYETMEGFEIKLNNYGKIIRIEEPTYTTVYEPKEKVKEMTIAELEKELGYKIKVVKEK